MFVPITENDHMFKTAVYFIVFVAALFALTYGVRALRRKEKTILKQIALSLALAPLAGFSYFLFMSSGAEDNFLVAEASTVSSAIEKAYPGSHVIEQPHYSNNIFVDKVWTGVNLRDYKIRDKYGKVQLCNVNFTESPSEKYLKNGVPAIVKCDPSGVKVELNSTSAV